MEGVGGCGRLRKVAAAAVLVSKWVALCLGTVLWGSHCVRFIDYCVARSFSFLLWGEPGVRCFWGWGGLFFANFAKLQLSWWALARLWPCPV